MATDNKKVIEMLMADPAFNAELNKRLAGAETEFRKQGIPKEEMSACLQDYTVAFVKQFLTIVGKLDQKVYPYKTIASNKAIARDKAIARKK